MLGPDHLFLSYSQESRVGNSENASVMSLDRRSKVIGFRPFKFDFLSRYESSEYPMIDQCIHLRYRFQLFILVLFYFFDFKCRCF